MKIEEKVMKEFYAELNTGVSFQLSKVVGRILEVIEASISDKEQRTAIKNIIKKIIWDQSDDIKKDVFETLEQFPEITGVSIENRLFDRMLERTIKKANKCKPSEGQKNDKD